MHGVDFLVDTIKAHPKEVTILAVGPLTNSALAFRKNPEIVPMVKRIVYMGGAIDVPGNVTPAAEFNWWFDPEAVRIVLRQPIEHVIGAQVTNSARFDKAVYDRISGAGTPVARIFGETYAKTFATDLGAAPRCGTRWRPPTCSIPRWPRAGAVAGDVSRFGPDYGRSLGHGKNPPSGPAEGQGRVRDRPRPVLDTPISCRDRSPTEVGVGAGGGANSPSRPFHARLLVAIS